MVVSHFHADHAGDVFNLVFARFVEDTYYGRESKKLIIWGPKGSKANFLKWRAVFWP